MRGMDPYLYVVVSDRYTGLLSSSESEVMEAEYAFTDGLIRLGYVRSRSIISA